MKLNIQGILSKIMAATGSSTMPEIKIDDQDEGIQKIKELTEDLRWEFDQIPDLELVDASLQNTIQINMFSEELQNQFLATGPMKVKCGRYVDSLEVGMKAVKNKAIIVAAERTDILKAATDRKAFAELQQYPFEVQLIDTKSLEVEIHTKRQSLDRMIKELEQRGHNIRKEMEFTPKLSGP